MSDKNVQLKRNMPASRPQETGRFLGVTRLQMDKGSMTQVHRQKTECLLIVLKGACRVYLENRVVILHESQMLHIPPHREHLAEALADSVILSILAVTEWDSYSQIVQNDADQYLWGV